MVSSNFYVEGLFLVKISISINRIWTLVVLTLLLKVVLYVYFSFFLEGVVLGGGNDADYYHLYALGNYNNTVAVNFWPVILRFLNENGLYDRQIITIILFIGSITLLPLMYYNVVKINSDENKLVKAGSYFLIIFYPTIFYMTADIYRDVFMFIIFLLSLLIYKKILRSGFFIGIFYFFIYLSLAFFLSLLRPYLGFALAVTPFIYLIFSKTKKYFKRWIIFYFVILILIKVTGGLNEILVYRESFGLSDGGTTFGISLLGKNLITFLFYYFLSILFQLFGLFFVNITSVAAFFLESLPFTYAFFFLQKNIKFMNSFVIFLLTFFVIYSTIWLLGNDNLGTAVRLRIPSYLAIFASMFITYQAKVATIYEKIKEETS